VRLLLGDVIAHRQKTGERTGGYGYLVKRQNNNNNNYNKKTKTKTKNPAIAPA